MSLSSRIWLRIPLYLNYTAQRILLAVSQRTGTPLVMGISWQEVRTATSGLPDNQMRKTFQFVREDLKGGIYAGVVTNSS